MAHADPLGFRAHLSDRDRLPLLAVLALRFADTVTAWDARARSRRALARLDRDGLNDIGLTARQAREEAARPFWQP